MKDKLRFSSRPLVQVKRSPLHPVTLSQEELNELCRAALCAWHQAPGWARTVSFIWKGKRYVAHHSTFRLKVNTARGEPVVACYD